MRKIRTARLAQGVMAAALVISATPILATLLSDWWSATHLAAASGTPTSIPGEVVLDLQDRLSQSQVDRLARTFGLTLIGNSPQSNAARLYRARVTPGSEASLLARLRREKELEAASVSYVYSLPAGEERSSVVSSLAGPRSGTPNDPLYPKQWNMRMVGAEAAWNRSRGAKVIVAVIDTGVCFEESDRGHQHRDLAGTNFVAGYDFVHDDAHPNDDHGHGTHVAGTIAETTNNGEGAVGLAHESVIMPIKVLDESGRGTTADIADAIRFAADHGARVINMSLGSPMPDQVLQSACAYASKKGVLIVCAAGNSGGGPVGYPAGYSECLAVSAVGPTGKLTRYSSVGRQIAIAAPGGDTSGGADGGILQNVSIPEDDGSWTDTYGAFQGTSMASPHVAATAALLFAGGVKDAPTVRRILQDGAARREPAVHYGAGLLDAARSLAIAETAGRDSLLRMMVTLLAGLTGLGVGIVRHGVKQLLVLPFVPVGLAMGLLGPDLLFAWLGYGSPFNLIIHSALIPLYLLWEVGNRPLYRFVAAMGLGMGVHLCWDAVQRQAPFAGVYPEHALPWLWLNALLAVIIAGVAWRRSEAAEA